MSALDAFRLVCMGEEVDSALTRQAAIEVLYLRLRKLAPRCLASWARDPVLHAVAADYEEFCNNLAVDVLTNWVDRVDGAASRGIACPADDDHLDAYLSRTLKFAAIDLKRRVAREPLVHVGDAEETPEKALERLSVEESELAFEAFLDDAHGERDARDAQRKKSFDEILMCFKTIADAVPLMRNRKDFRTSRKQSADEHYAMLTGTMGYDDVVAGEGSTESMKTRQRVQKRHERFRDSFQECLDERLAAGEISSRDYARMQRVIDIFRAGTIARRAASAPDDE